MKKHLSILTVIILAFFSCSIHKKISADYSDKEAIRNLKYVTNFPDDYFFPKGDSICEKILNRGKQITHLLIEKIDDTSKTSYIYADELEYKIGDIAVNLIDNLYDDSEFYLRELLENEFYKENKKDFPFLLTLYHEIFFLNSKKENFENRKRLKKVIYKWNKERIELDKRK